MQKKKIGDFSVRNGNNELDFSFLMVPAPDTQQNRVPETSGLPKEQQKKNRKPRRQHKPGMITPEQRKAVEAAQNKERGRGKTKVGRENIHFAADAKLVDAIKAIHYERGVTLNQLYNEALWLLVTKYKKCH